MIAYLKRVIALAHNKVTTYVVLAAAGLSQVAEHAQDIVDTWPSLMTYLPDVPHLKTVCHYVISVLGVLAVFTRIRRLLKS